jgi:hypothetical protein
MRQNVKSTPCWRISRMSQRISSREWIGCRIPKNDGKP